MLEFFRKFQKVLFAAVTFVLIFSLVFFGIFSTFDSGATTEDHSIGRAIDGTDISSRKMQRLIRFLSVEDSLREGGGLNDGVIRKDFLETGLGELLASGFLTRLKEDLDVRLARAKSYRPYAHPEAPFLSARSVWDRFQPSFSQAIVGLEKQKESDAQTFSYLSKLYLEQKKLPPELLRRILVYQMGQYSSIPFDRNLQHMDLSLFGYKDLQDWFGHRFIELAAECIWNGGILAREKGIDASLDEAKADLIFAFQRLKEAGHPLSFEENVQRLGMSEKDVIDLWQQVLLFRRYMASMTSALFLDTLFSKNLANYVEETALADVYTLPDFLVLKTADDFFCLQHYIDTIAPRSSNILALPKGSRKLEEIAKKSPEFVEMVFTADVCRVSKEELSSRVSLKEIIGWQEKHWDLLTKEFPALVKLNLHSLEGLNRDLRSEIDAWTGLKIVDEHPEWIEEAFQTAESVSETISFSAGKASAPYVRDVSHFIRSLEQAAVTSASTPKDLLCYSDGKVSLYRFTNVKKKTDLQLRTFQAMKQDGSLKKSLDGYLQSQYPKVREQRPSDFQTKSGEFKPFAEVKEAIGWAVYADICKAIANKEKLDRPDAAAYLRYRLAYTARSALEQMRDGASDPKAFELFSWVRQEKRIRRGLQDSWLETEAFSLKPETWSSLQILENNQMTFFYVKERKIDADSSLSFDLMSQALTNEARQMTAKKLIHRMQEAMKDHV